MTLYKCTLKEYIACLDKVPDSYKLRFKKNYSQDNHTPRSFVSFLLVLSELHNTF